jgi:ferric-dicitrate binding protein FerR (iron transport regulator)
MHLNQYDSNQEKLWLEGKISSEEFLSKLSASNDAPPFAKALERISGFDAPSNKSKNQIWAELETKISSEAKVIPLYRKYWIGIAASLILVVGAFFILKQNLNNETVIETSFAEVQSIYLPDSSLVHLNADSKLSFSEKEWNEIREVELEGEAFFEVKKGSDFTVNTNQGDVRVLGTSFNVKVRNTVLEVACKTGLVLVSNKLGTEKTELTPGWAVIVKDDNVKELTPLGLSYIDNWRAGEFDFESVMLSEVLSELQRQFDLKVEYDIEKIEDRPYTGFFNKNNLNEALQLVCNTMGLTFSIDGKTVSIKNKEFQNQ